MEAVVCGVGGERVSSAHMTRAISNRHAPPQLAEGIASTQAQALQSLWWVVAVVASGWYMELKKASSKASKKTKSGEFLHTPHLAPMAVLLYSAFASALLVPGGPAAVARGRAAVRMAALPFGAPLATLLEQHRAEVDELASRTASERGADENESWLLRFVLESESVDDAVASVNKVLQWRRGEGKPIVDAAAAAYEAATAGGGWNNEAAIGAAPNAAVICKYLKASQIQTIPDPQRGYLIYVIRASAIEDKALTSRLYVATHSSPLMSHPILPH